MGIKIVRIFLRILIAGMALILVLTPIVIFATFMIVKHTKLEELIEREIESGLGIQVTIGQVKHSPFLTHIYAEGVTIHNPAGFMEPEMAYIPSIHLIWDPGDMVILKKPTIYLCAVDLERLHIIKDRDGRVNIKELLPIKGPDDALEDKTPFFFDLLVLSVGTVQYTEYSASGSRTHTYTIGLKNETFVRLADENEVVKLIVSRAIQNTDIAKLVNLTLSPVVAGVSTTVDAAWGTAKSGAKSAWQIATMPLRLIFWRLGVPKDRL